MVSAPRAFLSLLELLVAVKAGEQLSLFGPRPRPEAAPAQPPTTPQARTAAPEPAQPPPPSAEPARTAEERQAALQRAREVLANPAATLAALRHALARLPQDGKKALELRPQLEQRLKAADAGNTPTQPAPAPPPPDPPPHPLRALSAQEQHALGVQHGREAFAAGRSAAAALDPRAMDLMRGLEMGEGLEYMRGYNAGWSRANAEAPVSELDDPPAPTPDPPPVDPPEPTPGPEFEDLTDLEDTPEPDPEGADDGDQGDDGSDHTAAPWTMSAHDYALAQGAPLPGDAPSAATLAGLTRKQRDELHAQREAAYARHDQHRKDWRDAVTQAAESREIGLDTPGMHEEAAQIAAKVYHVHAAETYRRQHKLVNNEGQPERLPEGARVKVRTSTDYTTQHTYADATLHKVEWKRNQWTATVHVDGEDKPKKVELGRVHKMTHAERDAEAIRRSNAELSSQGLPSYERIRTTAMILDKRAPRARPYALPGGQRPPGEGWTPIPATRAGGWHRKRPDGKWEHWYPDGRHTLRQQGAPEVVDAEPPARDTRRPSKQRGEAAARDPLADRSGRQEHHDVGEIVMGARKHTWTQVHAGNLEAIEGEGEATAAQAVIKSAVMGDVSPVLDRDLGSTAGAAFLKDFLRGAIAARPATPGRQGRQDFVDGVEWLREALDDCQTAADVDQLVGEMRWLAGDGRDYEEERPQTRETLEALAREYPPNTESNPFASNVRFSVLDATGKPTGEKIAINWGRAQFFGWVHAPGGGLRKTSAREAPYRAWFKAMGPRFAAIMDISGEVNRRTASETYREKRSEANQRELEGDWSKLIELKDGAAGPARGPSVGHLIGMHREKIKLERIGGAPIPENVTGETFAQTFGLRAVQYGNWIDDAKASAHLHTAYGALHDLADVIGVEPQALAHSHTLALAFGARGGGWASAHYEPSRAIINLTATRGGGALAHEWGHFMDHHLPGGALSTDDTQMFASEAHAGNLSPQMQDAYRGLMNAIVGRETLAQEGARLMRQQSALNRKARRRSEMTPAELAAFQRERDAFVKAAADYQVRRRERREMGKPTRFAEDASALGDYWRRPHEMFARAFEAYVEDKLEAKGRRNTYLTSGTREPLRLVRGTREVEIYPQGEERQRIAAAFDHLFETLRQTGELKKALERAAMMRDRSTQRPTLSRRGAEALVRMLAVLSVLDKAKSWTRPGVEQAGLFGARPASPSPAPGPEHVVQVQAHTRVTAAGHVVPVQAHQQHRHGATQHGEPAEMSPQTAADVLQAPGKVRNKSAIPAAQRLHQQVHAEVRAATASMADHELGDAMEQRQLGHTPWSAADPKGHLAKEAWRQVGRERLKARGSEIPADPALAEHLQRTRPIGPPVDRRTPILDRMKTLRTEAEERVAHLPKLRQGDLLEELPDHEEIETWRGSHRTVDDLSEMLQRAEQAMERLPAKSAPTPNAMRGALLNLRMAQQVEGVLPEDRQQALLRQRVTEAEAALSQHRGQMDGAAVAEAERQIATAKNSLKATPEPPPEETPEQIVQRMVPREHVLQHVPREGEPSKGFGWTDATSITGRIMGATDAPEGARPHIQAHVERILDEERKSGVLEHDPIRNLYRRHSAGKLLTAYREALPTLRAAEETVNAGDATKRAMLPTLDGVEAAIDAARGELADHLYDNLKQRIAGARQHLQVTVQPPRPTLTDDEVRRKFLAHLDTQRALLAQTSEKHKFRDAIVLSGQRDPMAEFAHGRARHELAADLQDRVHGAIDRARELLPTAATATAFAAERAHRTRLDEVSMSGPEPRLTSGHVVDLAQGANLDPYKHPAIIDQAFRDKLMGRPRQKGLKGDDRRAAEVGEYEAARHQRRMDLIDQAHDLAYDHLTDPNLRARVEQQRAARPRTTLHQDLHKHILEHIGEGIESMDFKQIAAELDRRPLSPMVPDALASRLKTAAYAVPWARSTGRMATEAHMAVRDLTGKDAAAFLADVAAHTDAIGEVPAYINRTYSGAPAPHYQDTPAQAKQKQKKIRELIWQQKQKEPTAPTPATEPTSSTSPPSPKPSPWAEANKLLTTVEGAWSEGPEVKRQMLSHLDGIERALETARPGLEDRAYNHHKYRIQSARENLTRDLDRKPPTPTQDSGMQEFEDAKRASGPGNWHPLTRLYAGDEGTAHGLAQELDRLGPSPDEAMRLLDLRDGAAEARGETGIRRATSLTALARQHMPHLVKEGGSTSAPEQRRADAKAQPWLHTDRSYAAVHGAEAPHIAEISAVQRNAMSGAALRRYEQDRAGRRAVVDQHAADWERGVRDAFLAGHIDGNTPGLSRGGLSTKGADDVIRAVRAEQRQGRQQHHEATLQAELDAKGDIKPGDRAHSVWAQKYGTVKKVLKQHTVMSYDDGSERKEWGRPARMSPEDFRAEVERRVRAEQAPRPAPITKSAPHAPAGRPGLALLPSKTDPAIKRWQLTTAEHAAAHGGQMARDLVERARTHLGRIPGHAWLHHGTGADLDRLTRSLEPVVRVHDRKAAESGTPPTLSPQHQRDLERLTDLVGIADQWKAPPPLAGRSRDELLRVIDLGHHLRRPEAQRSPLVRQRDPWHQAAIEAAQRLAPVLGGQLRDVHGLAERARALPKDFLLPASRITAGRAAEQLDELLPGIAQAQAQGQPPQALPLPDVGADLDSYELPPADHEILGASDERLADLHARAQRLESGDWRRARMLIQSERARRSRSAEDPVSQARAELSKLDDWHLEDAWHSYTRHRLRGLREADQHFETAYAEEVAHRRAQERADALA